MKRIVALAASVFVAFSAVSCAPVKHWVPLVSASHAGYGRDDFTSQGGKLRINYTFTRTSPARPTDEHPDRIFASISLQETDRPVKIPYWSHHVSKLGSGNVTVDRHAGQWQVTVMSGARYAVTVEEWR